MMHKRGFTIVEMLMVIGILAVLLGIITTASSTAIRQARVKRMEAMRTVLQAGLATYYTQKGVWPGALKSWCDNGPGNAKTRVDYLSDTQADAVFQELARESVRGSQMLDVTGLFVARASQAGSNAKNVDGMDFRAAMTKTNKRGKIPINQLAFGYATKTTGKFRRYIIKYNFETDSCTVLTQNEGDSSDDFAREMDTKYDYGRYRWPNKPSDGQ